MSQARDQNGFTDDDYSRSVPTLKEALRIGIANIDRSKMLEVIGWNNRRDFKEGHPTGQEIVDEVKRLKSLDV